MLAKSKGQSKRLRIGRWSARHQVYLITSCTQHREQVFADFYSARKLINILRGESENSTCTTLAFVVMPDHLHWLMQPDTENLSRIVGRVKSLSAREIGKPIWQDGYHDHALRMEEDIVEVARYIAMNPVRAKLVASPGMYPHWDVFFL